MNILDLLYRFKVDAHGVLQQQHYSAIENHFQKNKCQMETPDIIKFASVHPFDKLRVTGNWEFSLWPLCCIHSVCFVVKRGARIQA